jgi:hypothetical protein
MSGQEFRARFTPHIETLQLESDRLTKQILQLSPHDDCRRELENIYLSLSNVLAVMRTELNNIGEERQARTPTS